MRGSCQRSRHANSPGFLGVRGFGGRRGGEIKRIRYAHRARGLHSKSDPLSLSSTSRAYSRNVKLVDEAQYAKLTAYWHSYADARARIRANRVRKTIVVKLSRCTTIRREGPQLRFDGYQWLSGERAGRWIHWRGTTQQLLSRATRWINVNLDSAVGKAPNAHR